MADIDLPVYSFRANWADGVIERLLFLTTLLKGEEGAEQRFSRRITPRREAEADFLLVGPERTFYDLWIHRLAGSEFMAPLYWDASRIPGKLTGGVTDRIDFDTRWTEFEPGSLALIQRKSALTYEVVEIDSVDDDGLDLTTAVAGTWARGSTILPLRRAILDDMGSLTHYSAQVAGVSGKLAYVTANPLIPDTYDEVTYSGYPLFLQEPNWIDNLDVNLARDLVKLDNDTGIPYLTDPTGRSNVGQAHAWLLRDRYDRYMLKSFLYARRGRAEAFWLPTFKGDLELTETLLSAATQAIVKNSGLVYTQVPTSGRDHLIFFPRGGTAIPRRITATHPGTTAETEKVDLDLSPGLDLSRGLARKISFLDTAHFDQDEFEINHVSATVAEMSAAFRTFKDDRDPSGPIHYPIPAAEMGTEPCGDPGPCYHHDNIYRFRMQFLGALEGHDPDDRIGEPSLGFWMQPELRSDGTNGPDEFHCYEWAQWNMVQHPPDFHVGDDDFQTAQWVQCRIQAGTGTDGCPRVGSGYESIRTLVHKPGWPTWRAMLADDIHFPIGGANNFELAPDPVTGIGGFHGTGFPGTMYYWMPADYDPGDDPIGWAEYTEPYEGT